MPVMPHWLPKALHRWNLSPKAAIRLQRQLAGQIRVEAPATDFRLIVGLDAAFADEGRTCVAAAVLWDRATREVVNTVVVRRPVRFPYISGLLSFREAPALLWALRRLKDRPDLLMCDGQGRAHPRRLGIASHMGLVTGVPSVGCAKSLLVGTFTPPGLKRGSVSELWHKDELIGEVVRTQTGIRPLFISVGHALDQRTARELTLECAVRYRLPEPTHLADRLVALHKRHGPHEGT